MPLPFEQFNPIVPDTGTFNCIASSGVRRKTTDVVLPLASEGISFGVTVLIHDGTSMEIVPVSPLPTLVMSKTYSRDIPLVMVVLILDTDASSIPVFTRQ